MKEVQWKESYNVGNDTIDNAHKKLVSVLRTTEKLCRDADYQRNKYGCIESIKFLKQYTVQHFIEEENFMKSRDYAGFELHKKQHDHLREVTIPKLERKLVDSDYAKEDVMEFLGIFLGWLTSHILLEDRAITGRAISHFHVKQEDKSLDGLINEINKIVQGITDLTAVAKNEKYNGESMPDIMYYQMEYDNTKILVSMQNNLIYHMVGHVMGVEINRMDKDVLITFVQLINSLVKPLLILYHQEQLYKKSNKKMITKPEFENCFSLEPIVSLEFETEYGDFTISSWEID